MNPIRTHELTIPAEWDACDHEQAMISDEECLSATSSEEASKIFEEWQSDVELDIMEVDEQIGFNLLEDEIFHDPCISPSGPLEELVLMSLEDEDIDRFSLSFLELDSTPVESTNILPFDERYKATMSKLAESMRRSEQTRMSLRLKTSGTKEYERSSSVNGVLNSIEKSTQQLQVYLKKIHQV
jgi:hypothetical protein